MPWDRLGRREVLTGALAAGLATQAEAAASSAMPIIDCHIHLFDPRRPQGAPYRGPRNSPTYEAGALPTGYASLVAREHVVGAIKVEASPWIEDNLWAVETAATHPIMVGVIGNMQPDAPDFAAMIQRFAKIPLFRGIRYGNLWRYDLAGKAADPKLLAGLKLLADADLSLDIANPRIDLLQAAVRLSDAVPSLRIIADHLPHFDPKPDEMAAYVAVLREIAAHPNIFVKLSEVIHPMDGRVSTDLTAYRERLDLLSGTFGEDRLLFGSDWPNILQDTPLPNVFAIMRTYFAARGREARAKFFWGNSRHAYKWRPRSTAQSQLVDMIA